MDLGKYQDALMAQIELHAHDFIEALPRIAGAMVVIGLTWATVRVAGVIVPFVGRRFSMRRSLSDVISMVVAACIWVVGSLVASAIAFPSVTPADLLTALGLGSIAIGFAFKDIFENFFAGILILLREPFAIGDHIECGDIEGSVEQILVRDSHVRRTDGQLVVVPNAHLFQKPVTVRTNLDLRRAMIICGIAYGEDADRAQSVIHDAVTAVDSVRDDVRDVQVFAHGFGTSSVDFEIAWWTGSRPLDIRTSRDQVIRSVKRALDEADIEIPFPQRVVWMREEESADGGSSSDADEAGAVEGKSRNKAAGDTDT